MIAVSACLAGQRCTYDGGHNLVPAIKELVEKKQAIALCPEVLGGLSVPRARMEIIGGTGQDVLDGTAVLRSGGGEDLTAAFLKGARDACIRARSASAAIAILKSNSPSCGCGSIYDGSFSGSYKQGDGVTTALFKRHGITVMTERQFIQRQIQPAG